MKIVLLTPGKLKNTSLQDLAQEYEKRIGAFFKVEILEVRSEQTKEREGDRMMSVIAELTGSKKVLCLDENGKSHRSVDWARKLQDWQDQGIRQVVFCVGGAYGFSDELRNSADELIALGPQTLSHELCRVVLLEQIYRAATILNRHPYHNP